MKPRDTSRFAWQRRQLKTKIESFRLAMDTLCKNSLAAVRHVSAACDQRGHW